MKKLWIITLLLMLPVFMISYAQEVFYNPTPTIEWDEVYYSEPGLSWIGYELGARDTITQEIFIHGETEGLQYTYDISTYGNKVALGVRTKVAFVGGMTGYSIWNWSDEPEGTPFPFVFMAFSPDVPVPKNQRILW